MTAHKVLVTAVGGNVGQGVMKALRAASKLFSIVGVDMEPLAAGFSLADSHATVPRTGSPGFLERLRAVVEREAVEAIYVCSPGEVDFFSTHREAVEREWGTTVLVNPPEVVRVGSDKLLTAEFFRDAGLPYLETMPAADESGVDSLIRRVGFPLIVKPRFGAASKGVFLVHSRREIEAARVLVPDSIVQQYLDDDKGEYTAATLSGPDCRVRASIVLRRDLCQGTTYRTELTDDPALTAWVARYTEALGAVGVCNLQFRLLNGVPHVFEVNPRFSGASGIRYLYGFNEPELAFDLLRLGLPVTQPPLRPAVVLRYWDEILIPGATFAGLRQQGGARKAAAA